ncbi:pro-kumamolisin [Aureococcus anophagefferens]|nr:pro-kumamolisin [Aureococcus anophagefferens]
MLCLAMALRAEAALYVLDPTDWAADLGEDLDWATANAPFVRLPGHPAIERVYRQANYSCWWQNDDRDAMEVSISGAGCRPTIAAALYGDAAAVAAMAALDPRNDALVDEFAAYVNFSRAEPTPTRLELRNDAPIVAADPCDLEAVRVPGEPVDVRELLAYAPFAFEGLVDETRDYEPMFAQLFDEAGFAAPFGLTTAERRHPCFNYSWAHGDTWNQESWPYETSRLLKGLADRLHAGRGTASLTAASYAALLTAYAEQHRMYWTNNTEKDMGVHYFHSTFNDNVLAGLLGIRLDPRAVGRAEVRPLLDPARGPFAVDGVVLLDNRTLSATWDEAAGFAVYVDGVVRNRSDTVVPLWVDLDVAPEDAALEAALRRSSRRGRATRRIGAGVACVLLLAVASSAARSRDGLRTREMDVDGAAVKLAYYEKGARKEACDTHTVYVELQSDDAGLRAALDAVSSPTSPDFRKFWTPEESKSAFVVGDGDRVEAWLRSFGAETARASDAFVRATGPAFVFEAAFGCELCRFDAPHKSVDRCDGGYAVHDDIFDESVFETDLETYSPGDLEAFEAEFDLRKSRVSDVGAHVSDEACAADADACSEANLDVQYITALAPGAETVYWYLDETVLDVFVQYAVDLDAAEDTPLVNSISYGSFERENAPDAMEAFNRGDEARPGGATASWADDDAGEVVCESDVDDAVITSGGGFSEFNAAPAYAGTTYAAYLNATDPTRLRGGGRGYPDLAPRATATRRALRPWASSTRRSTRPSSGAFAHDVTSGNNKCVAENEFCCDEGFAARGGWDATTGWGSVHFPAYEKVLTADLAPDAVERAKARLRARGAAKKKGSALVKFRASTG